MEITSKINISRHETSLCRNETTIKSEPSEWFQVTEIRTRKWKGGWRGGGGGVRAAT